MVRSLILGVNGGGSSTDAWLAVGANGAEAAVIGRGAAGPSNAKAVGLASARAALEAAIRGAFDSAGLDPSPVASACLGLAGFDRPEDRAVLTGWADEARLARRLVLVNDGDLVVAAGTPEGWGVGVIAGTGSIAVGRTPDGRTARAGGWGHLIGDEGSAYLVVLEALRLVARRADGREPQPAAAGGEGFASGSADPLTVRLCRALGVDRPARIVTALYAPNPRAPGSPRWPPRSSRPATSRPAMPSGCSARPAPRWGRSSRQSPSRWAGRRGLCRWPPPAAS